MDVLTETAYAKINLALHIRSRRSDGYHELDTLFAFLNDGDVLHASLSDNIKLTISGPFASSLSTNKDNLVLRAADMLRSAYDIQKGADIQLEKYLPVASGMGGGSADAAATARLLNRLWNIGASEQQLADLMAPLGADIPACILSRTLRGRGTGTELTAITESVLTGMPILLINPGIPVSTADIFGQWNGADGGPLPQGNDRIIAMSGHNDLEAVAIRLHPEIADLLQHLRSEGAFLARMSGSGATCFGLFDTHGTMIAAQRALQVRYPDYWTMTGVLK